MGLVLALVLPDAPAAAQFLSEDEKALAARRVPVLVVPAGGSGGSGGSRSSRHGGWRDALAMLRSPVVVAFCALNVSTNIASYGIGAFLPAIVAELGYAQLEANLRTAPVYLFMAAFNICIAALADRLGERGWVVAGCLAASAGGMLLLALSIVLRWSLDERFALCFFVVFYSATSPLQLAWLQRAYRNRTEAAVGPALVLTIGSLGAFVGPLVYGNTTTGAGADTSSVQGHFALFGVWARSGAGRRHAACLPRARRGPPACCAAGLCARGARLLLRRRRARRRGRGRGRGLGRRRRRRRWWWRRSRRRGGCAAGSEAG